MQLQRKWNHDFCRKVMQLEIIMIHRISQTVWVFFHLQNLDLKLWCMQYGGRPQSWKGDRVGWGSSKESVGCEGSGIHRIINLKLEVTRRRTGTSQRRERAWGRTEEEDEWEPSVIVHRYEGAMMRCLTLIQTLKFNFKNKERNLGYDYRWYCKIILGLKVPTGFYLFCKFVQNWVESSCTVLLLEVGSG